MSNPTILSDSELQSVLAEAKQKARAWHDGEALYILRCLEKHGSREVSAANVPAYMAVFLPELARDLPGLHKVMVGCKAMVEANNWEGAAAWLRGYLGE